MSKFFTTGTDSESESSSEEEQIQRAPAAAFTVSIPNYFICNIPIYLLLIL